MVTITSGADNGDGTYTITFSEAITWDTDTTPDGNWLLQVEAGAAEPVHVISQPTTTTLIVAADDPAPDQSPTWMTGQPAHLSAAHSFATNPNVVTIPGS